MMPTPPTEAGPAPAPNRPPRWTTALRWTGRVLALLFVLLWGGFFLEHLKEWVIDVSPPRQTPPRVLISVGLHGLMLVALLAACRWELVGGAIALAASAAFFASMGQLDIFLKFFPPTALPALLLLVCGLNRRRRRLAPAPLTT